MLLKRYYILIYRLQFSFQSKRLNNRLDAAGFIFKFILLAVFFSSFNCATIFEKKEFKIAIETNVSGARVEYKYTHDTLINSFLTPGYITVNFRDFKLNQSDPYIDILSSGYETEQVFIRKTFSRKALLNFLLIFSTPFFLIDILSGAIWKPEKDKYFIELKKKI